MNPSARRNPPAEPELLAWARRFLPHYFEDEPADFHRELAADLADDRKRCIARVAPRGHAKSTCTALALPLWSICEQRRKNIVIITHETSLATQFVRDIRRELECNEHIRETYGDLTPAVAGRDPQPSTAPPDAPATPRKRPKQTDPAQEPKPPKRPAAPRKSKRSAEAPDAPAVRVKRPLAIVSRREVREPDAAPPPETAEKADKPARSRRAATPASRPKWTESTFTTPTGITVHAKGSGASLRGTRVGPHRPDLIICDDIEKDETVATADGRRKVEHWLRRVVMPALAPAGRIVVLGSLLHHDSLLANLRDHVRFPGWDYRIYRALEPAETKPLDPPPLAPRAPRLAHAKPPAVGPAAPSFELRALWPARWPVERLIEERARIGVAAFEQEYQANPVDDAARVFRPEWLRREDPPAGNEDRLTTLMAVDPATGVESGDFFALWVGSIHRDTGVIYTRELLLERIGIVDQIRRIRDAFTRWRPVRIGIESNAYQVALRDILEEISRREGDYMPLVPLRTTDNKLARIEGAAPFFENGTFRLPVALSAEAEAQFLQFPAAKHDDAPDVCAMGIALARQFRTATRVEALAPFRPRFDRRGGW